jgi:hypothetical protein
VLPDPSHRRLWLFPYEVYQVSFESFGILLRPAGSCFQVTLIAHALRDLSTNTKVGFVIKDDVFPMPSMWPTWQLVVYLIRLSSSLCKRELILFFADCVYKTLGISTSNLNSFWLGRTIAWWLEVIGLR